MTASNRFWLYSQAGMAVITGLFAVIGILLVQLGDDIGNDLAVRINSYFLLPGMVVSLIVNHVVLLKRAQPRIVTTPERVALAVEYAMIVLLVVCSLSGALVLLGIVLALGLVPIAIVLLVLITSRNRGPKGGQSGAPATGFAPPSPGDRII